MNKMLLIGLLALCARVSAAGLVPFAPPWDDTAPGPTDLRATIPRPAGADGFIVARGGHFYAGDHRLRLFGVNFTAAATLPEHATADRVAVRLAKFGFNAVRLHFLDATWGEPRLIDYASGDSRNWNSNSLDRLDYFIACLRREGIYVDLNLLVGRLFDHRDGVDSCIQSLDWKTAHAVGFFHAPLLAAQQQYARQLLTHRNSYTRLTYVDDPAVALVEIINENGLVHAWLGGELDALSEPFAVDLRAQWNAWLALRHATDEALALAWHVRAEPLATEMLSADGFHRGLRDWVAEQHEDARVEATTSDGIARLHVLRPDAVPWHVQFNRPGLALASNGLYTFSFRARADQPRRITIAVRQAHEPWLPLGLQTEVALESQWNIFRYTFSAGADMNARLEFTALNQAHAIFEFADVSLRPGGRVGMPEGESLASRTLGLPKPAGTPACTPEQRADCVRFLLETERRYWLEMRRFLRDELRVRAPLVGTIVGCSTPNLMAELDAIDTHAYWQHPEFPGKPWDPANWRVRNISMVDYPAYATIPPLAFARVAGKAHLVTEYNHPAPNFHAGEGPLMLAAYAALQDWDGIFLYSYAHDERGIKAGCIPGFFDVGQHPTELANVPAASLLFRRADVAPARQCLALPLSPTDEAARISQKGHAWNVLPADTFGIPLTTAFSHRIALNLAAPAVPTPLLPGAADTNSFASDTGELLWRLPVPDQGVLTLRAPRAKFVIGHVDGQTLDLGDGVFAAIGSTRNHWCTLALIVLEGDGGRRQLHLPIDDNYTYPLKA